MTGFMAAGGSQILPIVIYQLAAKLNPELVYTISAEADKCIITVGSKTLNKSVRGSKGG